MKEPRFPGENGFRVDTQAQPDASILQTVTAIREGVPEQILRTVLNTREAGIRKALIELGWTPPPDDDPTPYCLHCGPKSACDCGPIAEND